jgi:hypothetical protein
MWFPTEENTNYPGDDIIRYQNIESEDECKQLCLANAQCQVAQWGKGLNVWLVFGTKPCWLKTAAGERRDYNNIDVYRLRKADRPQSKVCPEVAVSQLESKIFKHAIIQYIVSNRQCMQTKTSRICRFETCLCVSVCVYCVSASSQQTLSAHAALLA